MVDVTDHQHRQCASVGKTGPIDHGAIEIEPQDQREQQQEKRNHGGPLNDAPKSSPRVQFW